MLEQRGERPEPAEEVETASTSEALAAPLSIAPLAQPGPGRPHLSEGQGRPEQVARYHAEHGADATMRKFNFTPDALARNLHRARKATGQ
jgi:hypothetical protein